MPTCSMPGRPIRRSAASSTTSGWSLGRSTGRRSPRSPAQRAQRPADRRAGRGRRPLGTVGWHKVGYGPGTASEAWNIGIELLPDARGQGYGGEAQAQLAVFLFAETPANRIEAQTDIENVAEQRSLEKAGFRREGVARGSQFRAGALPRPGRLLAAARRPVAGPDAQPASARSRRSASAPGRAGVDAGGRSAPPR